MITELTPSRIEDTLTSTAGWSRRCEDVLPLWLTRQEAEAVLQLCTASPALVEETAEDALFAKLGDLFRAFRQ